MAEDINFGKNFELSRYHDLWPWP